VQLSSFFKRAAFALRLGDFNLLISDQITDKSRIMFVRDPVQMAEKAAPFLTFNQNPYAVVSGGQIYWIVDGYTTTNQYPYSQNADTQQVASGSSLPASYNYVRNSVKVVINAYSGKMTFYDADPRIRSCGRTRRPSRTCSLPLSKMSSGLQAHLRYPPDIFSIQSAIYGRYHLTVAVRVLRGQQRLAALPTAGAGPSAQSLQVQENFNQQGQLVSTSTSRMAPLYQVTALPGSKSHADLHRDRRLRAGLRVEAHRARTTPTSPRSWWATSDPTDYGKLTVYETPQGTTGPANADSYIQANNSVSQEITFWTRRVRRCCWATR
jgi:uncharacterized membrane protein (UPF0182 family)